MAEIVLGIGTSHSPMLSLPAEQWSLYQRVDPGIEELLFPPEGKVLPYAEILARRSAMARSNTPTLEEHRAQEHTIHRALDALSATLGSVQPDITVIISDDQDEWFFDNNMPRFAIYWGDSVRLIPQLPPGDDPGSVLKRQLMQGYGDVELDVPVASDLGRATGCSATRTQSTRSTLNGCTIPGRTSCGVNRVDRRRRATYGLTLPSSSAASPTTEFARASPKAARCGRSGVSRCGRMASTSAATSSGAYRWTTTPA